MLRLEEPREQRVDLEQPGARQSNRVTVNRLDEAVDDERVERLAERLADIDAKLSAEVPGVELSGLHQEDHLTDEPLVVGDGQRPVQRKLARIQLGEVLLPRVDVLVMHALEVPERRDARADEVGPAPQRVAIDEAGMALGLDQRVGAGDDVALSFELPERVIDPRTLLAPTCDLRDSARLTRILGDAGVVRDFHLIDRDAVGVHRDSSLDGVLPLVLGLAEHAGDQVDVDLREADVARPCIRLPDLRRLMSPAVDRQDLVVEVLDAQRQPRHADFLDRAQLAFLQRARLAFERDFLGRVPAPVLVDPLDEPVELLVRQVRRRAAAEVYELELTSLKPVALGVEGDLTREGGQVYLDVAGVLVRIDAEVEELAPLAAERDVQVQPQRRLRRHRVIEHVIQRGEVVRRPNGERRVVGDEVAADLGRWLRLGRLGEGRQFHRSVVSYTWRPRTFTPATHDAARSRVLGTAVLPYGIRVTRRGLPVHSAKTAI